MFLAVFATRRVSAQVTGKGEFFCLRCRADCSYEQRRWQWTWNVFSFWPVGGGCGEFVLCRSCGNAYDLECLDETSTAELDELLVELPAAVTRLPGVRPALEKQMSGYSQSRRH